MRLTRIDFEDRWLDRRHGGVPEAMRERGH